MTQQRRETFGALGRIWNRLTSPQPVSGWVVPVGGSKIPGVRLSDWRQTLQVPAVFRCAELVSNSVAMLPWGVHKDEGNGKRTPQPDNPVHWLLHDEPSTELTAFDFKKTLLTHSMLQGNGYAEIERNRRGTPVALHLIDDPDRVTPGRRADGRVAYKVQQAGGASVVIDAGDMFHVRGFSCDGIVGIGLLEHAARTLGVSIALEQVAQQYFTQGMRTPGFIKTKGKMSLDGLKAVIKMIREEFTGLKNFEMPIPLDQDMEFQAAGSTMHDAEFLSLRKASVIDVCRLFGVPPHLAYDLERATFSNIEAQDLTFLKYGLLPRIVPMEQEANRKMLTHRHGGLYSKMNVNAFARGDMAAQIAFFKGMRDMGAYSVNDILEKLDESTIGPEGDVRTQQIQYQPIGDKPTDPATGDDEEDEDDETKPAPPKPKRNGALHA